MLIPIILTIAIHSSRPAKPQGQSVKTVAILPWIYRGGTDTAVRTGNDTLGAFFDDTKYDRISKVKVLAAWEDQMGQSKRKELGDENDPMPDMPSEKDLLALGQKLNADLVCAGRAKWHTKSVWVALGPKTKAECTVDLDLIDVQKGEVILNERGIKADDTKVESGLETAAAILISMGFTAFSGGPKTPHQQASVQHAMGLAFEPWLRPVHDTKIK